MKYPTDNSLLVIDIEINLNFKFMQQIITVVVDR